MGVLVALLEVRAITRMRLQCVPNSHVHFCMFDPPAQLKRVKNNACRSGGEAAVGRVLILLYTTYGRPFSSASYATPDTNKG